MLPVAASASSLPGQRVFPGYHPAPAYCTGSTAVSTGPSLSCYYGLMCQSAGLSPALLIAREGVLAGWTTPGWSRGPARRYLCASFPACLDPYPGSSRGALTRYFPQDFGLPPVRTGSALSNVRTATSVRGLISGLQSFSHVQARRFAHHPGRSYRYDGLPP